MSEGLISSEIKKSLETIIYQCFYANRLLDRISSVLSVTFVMPATSNIVHKKFAHLYPVLADDISDYMDERGCTTIYEATPIGDQEYDTALDCFNKMLEVNLELEKKVRESIELAMSTNDYSTKVVLEKFLLKVLPVTKNILILVDKAEMYGDGDNQMMKFDSDVSDFKIFED